VEAEGGELILFLLFITMNLNDILSNQVEIVECAKSFRNEANELVHSLAKEFNFSLDADTVIPHSIYLHKYNNKGLFRNEWSYYFHGAECRFENIVNGQVIEIIYITKPEFGYLDSYFFYSYMQSTNKYKNLAIWFGNPLNVSSAIEILADKKFLRKDPFVKVSRNIIAI
jgi:hypothetical protein